MHVRAAVIYFVNPCLKNVTQSIRAKNQFFIRYMIAVNCLSQNNTLGFISKNLIELKNKYRLGKYWFIP